MRFAQYNTAAVIEAYLPARPDAAGTATVYAAAGGVLGSSITPTLDSVNTTLSGAASAGASTLSLTSATGVTVGRRYLVGGAETVGGEFVTVKSLSGTTATLVRPLRRAQASGAAVQGTRVTFTLSTTHTATCARGFRIEYPHDVSSVAQPPAVIAFDVTRYYPQTYLSVEDVRDLDPVLAKRLPEGTWLPALIARAWNMLCVRVAQKADPGGFAGHLDLTSAHSYMVRALLAETAGEDFASYRDDVRTRAAQELSAALAAIAYDADQNGNASVGSGWRRGVSMVRSG